MYELKSATQIDEAANTMIHLVTDRPAFVRFEDYNAACHKCGYDMDVYYCESRTYAVRCSVCGLLTLCVARSPEEAIRRVAANENP